MRIKEIINEAPPLPDDWDSEAFDNDKSFASRVRYAKERAKTIGTGSARIAFEIEYQGRPTILKIAKNKKGIAQNEYEANMFNDHYLTVMGITIPMIDHDEKNDPPTWLHVEKAEKMKPTQFKKFFNGMAPREAILAAKYMSGKWNFPVTADRKEKYNKIFEENETFSSLVDLLSNYDIEPGDFMREANWGIYKGEAVIIDLGASTDVISLHYS